MWRSTFVPETDRTCWTIQTHSDQLYWARRRTFHELNSLSFLRPMKSSTFGLVLMSHITCDVEVENWKCWKVGCVADGVVWWSARGSYQENRAETNFESVQEIQHFLHMLNSYCAHTASIILNHWKLEFFWNYLQASTQRICVLRSQYCCVLKAIQFGKVAVFLLFFFFSLPRAVAETCRFLELCWLLFFLLLLSQLFVGVVVWLW